MRGGECGGFNLAGALRRYAFGDERGYELNRTNCVRLLLSAFKRNDVVKALVFVPGATFG